MVPDFPLPDCQLVRFAPAFWTELRRKRRRVYVLLRAAGVKMAYVQELGDRVRFIFAYLGGADNSPLEIDYYYDVMRPLEANRRLFDSQVDTNHICLVLDQPAAGNSYYCPLDPLRA